jgi:protein-L-isoaspartate O-methyltransferase
VIDWKPLALVAAAVSRLAQAGYHPTLTTGDGAEGLADHSPYDRIIATCSIQHIPPPGSTNSAPEGCCSRIWKATTTPLGPSP